jgi:FkbM family methyltransferase
MNSLLLFLETFFTKTYFYKINKFLYLLSVKGMGIDNKFTLVHKGDKMLMTKLLKKTGKQIVIDVGANVGNYAEEVLSYNPDIDLYAFEPHPKTFLTLQEKAKKYGFKTVNKGCANSTGKLKFYDYANNDGSEHATLLEGVFSDLYNNNETIVHEVDVTTLDAFIIEYNIEHVDLLKIDTEGFEYSVMSGCLESIKNNKIKAIHFEFNSMNIISKVFMKDFIKILPQYSFYRVLPNGLLKVEQHNILLTEIFGFQNIVAINNQIK